MVNIDFKRILIIISLWLFLIGSIQHTQALLVNNEKIENTYQKDNTVSRFSIGINYISRTPISITSDIALASEAVSGSGSVNDPYIIEGYSIISSNLQHGISVSGTSLYFVIRGNYIDTGGLSGVNGIRISGVANGTALILNNTIENNDKGIFSQSTTFIHIANNSIQNNLQYGIEIPDGSNNALIEGNLIIQKSGEGIRLESANSIVKNNYIVGDPSETRFNVAIGVHRNNAMIINNTISDCTRGIEISPIFNALISNNFIDGCWSGMGGWPSDSEISNNTLLNGRFADSGIALQGQIGVEDSNNNEIKWNLIMNYPGYGINIFGDSAGNIIHHNLLLNNNIDQLGASQALDNNFNQWYDSTTSEGNYWSDYSGSGVYTVVGGAQDLYPLSTIDLDQDGMGDGWEFEHGLDLLRDDSSEDEDADGLTNLGEFLENLNPTNPDTDGDGIPDGFELDIGLNPTSPFDGVLDLDGDGMTNIWEYQNSLNLTLDDSAFDPDNDTLTNIEELLHNTDPNNNDTDADGLVDGYEVNISFSDPLNADTDADGLKDGEEVHKYNSDPLDNDSDDDGLTDGQEIIIGTDPILSDSDLDGIPDGWEVDNGLNPLVDDASNDPDVDGLTNAGEFIHNTDPINSDTDYDGIPDGWEVDNGFNPLVDDASNDPDVDGLTNGEEFTHNTDPINSDTDNDGLSDGDELNIHNTDPLNSDTDGDGFSDGTEIEEGTDPNNIDSFPMTDQSINTSTPISSSSDTVSTASGVPLFQFFSIFFTIGIIIMSLKLKKIISK